MSESGSELSTSTLARRGGATTSRANHKDDRPQPADIQGIDVFALSYSDGRLRTSSRPRTVAYQSMRCNSSTPSLSVVMRSFSCSRICKSVAVMRRRSDSWLNATQILKVAGFDKPQRTRVLEREVQKAEHEKVQGGYGKYQGKLSPIISNRAALPTDAS